MQRLEVSGAVRPIYVSLGIKRLRDPRSREFNSIQFIYYNNNNNNNNNNNIY